MHPIEWTDALRLGYQPMDQVHHELVDLLALAQTAPDEALPQAWSAVLEHTVQHFGREDDWMRQTRFTPADGHMLQHRMVLNLIREGLAMARSKQLQPVREMADELAAWLLKHIQQHDAALALHLQREPSDMAPLRASRAGRPVGAAHPG